MALASSLPVLSYSSTSTSRLAERAAGATVNDIVPAPPAKLNQSTSIGRSTTPSVYRLTTPPDVLPESGVALPVVLPWSSARSGRPLLAITA